MMVVICCWCKEKDKLTIMSDATPAEYSKALEEGTVSHGMCEACQEEWLDGAREVDEDAG